MACDTIIGIDENKDDIGKITGKRLVNTLDINYVNIKDIETII